MTTAGFVSGTRDETTPSSVSRVAAAASLLLGGVLLDALPDLMDAAFYVAVLAAASAAVAIVSGYVVWTRASLVARTVAALAAGVVLVGGLLQFFLGLPGIRGAGPLTPLENGMALATASLVLVFVAADAVRRTPEEAPDRPYAL